MSPVVGVDGGGTRTRALVADDSGAPLGSGEGPAGLVTLDDVDASARAVRVAVGRALDEAGLEPPVDALWAGLAGAGGVERRQAVVRALEAMGLARAVGVGTDVEAGYRDAFGTEVGILLVAGTGSIALGRDGDGAWVRVGGWGSVLGDEGSGYWVGLRALRGVLAGHDGRGPETALEGPLLAAFDVTDPGDLVDAVAGASKAEVARLASTVGRLAREGDPVAAAIVSDAAAVLAEHVEAAARRMRVDEPVPVAWTGGLLAPGRPVEAALRSVLASGPYWLRSGEVRPERGAVSLALELGGG